MADWIVLLLDGAAAARSALRRGDVKREGAVSRAEKFGQVYRN
jgi:hypothetical protein